MIQGRFTRVVEKADDSIPIEEVEHQESVVFHTFGDLDKYKDVLLVEEEE